MKSLLLSAASAMVLASTAYAADLPALPVEEVPEAIVATSDWSGFYVGAQIGGVWLHDDDNCDTDESFFCGRDFENEDLDAAEIDLFDDDDDDDDDGGFQAGVVVGADWQRNNFVIGVLADVNWVDIGRSEAAVAVINPEIFDDNDGDLEPNIVGLEWSEQIDWYGTARLRAGFTAGRALIYGTGGLAVGGGDTDSRLVEVFGDDEIEGTGEPGDPFVFEDGTELPAGCEGFSQPDETLADGDADFAVCEFEDGDGDGVRVGFSAGAGVDFLVTQNLSVGAEYLYVNLGDRDDDEDFDIDGIDGDDDDDDDDLGLSTLKVKAAYRF